MMVEENSQCRKLRNVVNLPLASIFTEESSAEDCWGKEKNPREPILNIACDSPHSSHFQWVCIFAGWKTLSVSANSQINDKPHDDSTTIVRVCVYVGIVASQELWLAASNQ